MSIHQGPPRNHSGENGMTSTEIETRNGGGLTPRVSQATRVGQATAVEQARAVAEVEAQVVVAMRNPRSVSAAVEAMREECRQPRLRGKGVLPVPARQGR